MTTTAVRPRARTLPRDRNLMEITFRIAERGKEEQPRSEDASCVGAMRRLAKTHLNNCGLMNVSDDTSLIVSELVTNAIVHSNGTKITLMLDLRDGRLHIAVCDEMPGHPAVRNPGDDEETGRGLRLVEWIAEAHNGTWGTSDDGATTWCTLAVAGAHG